MRLSNIKQRALSLIATSLSLGLGLIGDTLISYVIYYLIISTRELSFVRPKAV